MSEWISAEEMLPEAGTRVLIVSGEDNDIEFGCYTGRADMRRKCSAIFSEENAGYDGCPDNNYWVTHWMPLPEPPKEKP